jgi:spermidine/putrescine ABC transporter ATP-binding subunit
VTSVASLALEGISKRFGGFTAVDDISLRVEQGEFLSLLGPSGCGKSTILRMVAGLLEPDEGRMLLGDRDITHLPAHRRGIGLVFQSYALFPHMNVFENVAFGLRMRGCGPQELRHRVNAALSLVHLAELTERFPGQLSGGQQQRVALARALAPEPPLLLLDEPLSNLDAKLRENMQVELKRIQHELGITTVFVTHDQSEALTLSDRVCILDQGHIQQSGTPESIYFRPANSFVAGFLGRSNHFTGQILAVDGTSTRVALDNGLTIDAPRGDWMADTPVQIVLRQESLELIDPAEARGANTCVGRVVLRSFAGATTQYLIELDGGGELMADVPTASLGDGADTGGTVGLRWTRDSVIVIAEGN